MNNLRDLCARCLISIRQLGLFITLLLVLFSAPLKGTPMMYDKFAEKCDKGSDIAAEIQKYRNVNGGPDLALKDFLKEVYKTYHKDNELTAKLGKWVWQVDPKNVLPPENVGKTFKSTCMDGIAYDGAAGL